MKPRPGVPGRPALSRASLWGVSALAGLVVTLSSGVATRYIDCGFLTLTDTCGGYFAGVPFRYLRVAEAFPVGGLSGIEKIYPHWMLASLVAWLLAFFAWTWVHARLLQWALLRYAAIPVVLLLANSLYRELWLQYAEQLPPSPQLPFEVISLEESTRKNAAGGCQLEDDRMPSVTPSDPVCLRLVIRFKSLPSPTESYAVSYELYSRPRVEAEYQVGRVNLVTYLRAQGEGLEQFTPARPEDVIPGGEVEAGFDLQVGRRADARHLFVLMVPLAQYQGGGGRGTGFFFPLERVAKRSAR